MPRFAPAASALEALSAVRQFTVCRTHGAAEHRTAWRPLKRARACGSGALPERVLIRRNQAVLGEDERHRGSHPLAALEPHLAAVQVHQALDDREAKPASGPARAGEERETGCGGRRHPARRHGRIRVPGKELIDADIDAKR